MSSIYDVDATELIEKLAEELKKIEHIKPVAWAQFVKTGMHKERPPIKRDWWYTRAASILRYIQIRGPIGVHKLRIKYGGKKNRGVAAEHFYKASGNIIRKILQQLEKAELIKKGEAGIHKGRIITQKGLKLLNNVVKSLLKARPVKKKQGVVEEIKKKEKPKKEEKKETTNDKIAEIVKKTKEFAEGKTVTAEKLVEEAKKEEKKPEEKPKGEPKKEKPKEAPKEEKKPAEKAKEEKKEVKEAPKEEPKPEVKKNG